MRSTTLIPVIKISLPCPYSTKVGASLWIGNFILVLIGPLSSIGYPMTFMILPKHSGPTGTMIGLPVSSTGYPLTRPSVASMAMVLTLESPKWWETSKINFLSIPLTSRAFKMAGNGPLN